MHKLLLADDSVTIQRVIELTFSGEDVQVLAVNDGEQAIARIPLERPDVVLADIGMPRKGGYDVSAFVKGRPDLAHIPVLLLAGAFEPVDQARAEQVKADGVLIKPFEPRQVIERVKELLAGCAQAPAAPAPAPEPERRSGGRAGARGRSRRPPWPTPATEAAQSLDELFESLNHALTRAGHATRACSMEPRQRGSQSLGRSSNRSSEPRAARPRATGSLRAADAGAGQQRRHARRLLRSPERRLRAGQRAVQPGVPAVARSAGGSDAAGCRRRPPAAAPAACRRVAGAGMAVAGRHHVRFERRGDETNPILEAVTALMAQGSENGSTQAAPSARSDAPAAAA